MTFSKLSPPQTVLIIGAGEFGATTALHLALTTYRNNTHLITVLDRSATPPATDAASYDFNKLVRQEYALPEYARLAHEAMDLWRTPQWRNNYHESGIVVAVSKTAAQSDYITRALAANEMPGMQTPGLGARVLDGREEVERVYPEGVPLGDFAQQNVYINYAGGWANARGATEAVVERARALGVRFRVGTAAVLITDATNTTVLGVTTTAGERMTADRTIACAGSWTPTLVPELATECLPTGQVVGTIQLSASEMERYRDVPATRMVDNGFYIFPPTAEGVVKFAIHQKGYLNPQGGMPSVPRTALTGGFERQQVPEAAQRALLAGLKRVYPELAAKEWSGSRICWYSDRPSGDFLMDYHPGYGVSLFVAAGCCGHAFKFMPILGKLIVQSIYHELPDELARLWAWQAVEGRKDESRQFSDFYRLDVAENTSRL